MRVNGRAKLVMSALCLLVPVCPAETPQKAATETTPPHYGYPIDWSSRQLVMAGANSEATLNAGQTEPRHVYNMVRRMAAVEREKRHHHHHRERHRDLKIDWSVSLENGYVGANQYPAKYSFQVNSDDCNNDYVIFGLTLASGAGTQANLVGINNLYTNGTLNCHAGTPWVAFAYNTITHAGGQIRTSPVIGPNGDKVAFIESTASGSYFHVLGLPNPIPTPPAQTGNVLNPQTPNSLLCASPTSPGCMTTVQISSAANTLASPWVDYTSDIAYVATDDGNLYKITPVFRSGTPALVNDSNWPVAVVPSSASSKALSGPVLDGNVGRIFLGDANGNFYAVDINSPAHTTSATVTIGSPGAAGAGVVDPPLILSADGVATDQVFVFTGCTVVVGDGAAVAQLPANFANGAAFWAMNLGGNTGNSLCTGSNGHMGAVDNAFWTGGYATGHLLACGFTSGGTSSGGFPFVYVFAFDGNDLLTSTTATKNWGSKVDKNKGEECSPLTEFYDGTSDRIFFGTGSTGTPGTGAINSSVITVSPLAFSTVTAPSALGGSSGIIIDNQVSNGGTNIYFSTLAHGSVNGQSCAATGGAASPYCAVKLTQAGLQ